MKTYIHTCNSEYGDKFAKFSIALLAEQKGFIIEGPECYTTLNNWPEAIHDAYTGLIADGEEVICNKPTLNSLLDLIRDRAHIHLSIIPKIPKDKETVTNIMSEYTYDIYYMKTGVRLIWNNRDEDYNKVLESGLEYILDNYIP